MPEPATTVTYDADRVIASLGARLGEALVQVETLQAVLAQQVKTAAEAGNTPGPAQ